ncbi:MAG: nitrate/nitrite transporter NrtS [bacterium]
MMEWIRIASEPSVLRRALGYAVVVGAILIIINHWDTILPGELKPILLIKTGLTITVPYLVSTLSSGGLSVEIEARTMPEH